MNEEALEFLNLALATRYAETTLQQARTREDKARDKLIELQTAFRQQRGPNEVELQAALTEHSQANAALVSASKAWFLFSGAKFRDDIKKEIQA